MRLPNLLSDFIRYLLAFPENGLNSSALPPISEISKELGISIASLREQIEVAKALGLVEVRPRTGIRRLPYSFLPAVRQSLGYAISLDRAYFETFSDLRNHVEAAYWEQAAALLTQDDQQFLRALMEQAWAKLRGIPIQIPHEEHRKLHLAIFSRLDNVFVQGLLEAYWEAYEAAGLNVYADYYYLQEVWRYHQEMVDSICCGDFEAGYRALVEHKDLLHHRPDALPRATPEQISTE